LSKENLTYRHVVNLGDLISVLPGIKRLYEQTGKRAIVYQQLNRPGEYYLGAQHPTTDSNGAMVCFNEQMFDMMRPLLLAQDYIEDFRVYKGEQVDYDLDVVRMQTYCGAPHFPLHKWTWMAYPEMTCDLSKSWIKVPDAGNPFYKRTIAINFTDRYRNFNINYFFLKKYEKNIIFLGTPDEHKSFSEKWNLDIPHFQVDNFLRLATVIHGADLFIGNQSFCWHVAQAMHVPRILELYPFAQNCTNFGADGFEFYHQPQLEYFVNQLYNNG
jgi:hypothetical protein